jgi:hypothetical protein
MGFSRDGQARQLSFKGETPMSAARICFFGAATLVLSACSSGGDIPPPATGIASSSPKPAPVAVLASSITTPAPRAASKAAPPVVRMPAPGAAVLQPAEPLRESVTLDLNALKKRLKETKSIGLFSKLSLKNKVDDLLDDFRKYYQGEGKIDITELRESYNLLLMKVLSMLQDDDQDLAAMIVSSREAIWDVLADPKKFAALDI